MEPIRTDLTEHTGPYDGDWTHLVKVYEEFGADGKWIFRGLNNSAHKLQTSLERAVIALGAQDKNPTAEQQREVLQRKFEGRTVSDFEGELIRSFRRKCHHYVQPAPTTPLEVLALMQHYSAPTRLQDWTYSFHVAVFFALDAASLQHSEKCAVWALDTEWFTKRLQVRHPDLYSIIDNDRNFQKLPTTFKQAFRQERLFVCPVNPYYLNDRHIIQQEVFLCPGAVRSTFEENLAELQYDESGGNRVPAVNAAKHLFKFDISTAPADRQALLRQLFRMNISNATLFPGLEGFGRSLETALTFPHTLEHGEKYDTEDFAL